MVTKQEVIAFIERYYSDTEDIYIANLDAYKTIALSLRLIKKASISWMPKEGRC